jgi:ketosteroid isomerase-like protein
VKRNTALSDHEERITRELTDRAEIADAIYRYTAGLDFGDAELLASSLTEDAVVDLTAATAKLGLEFPALTPRDLVVDALTGAVGPLDTSHCVTNVRIDLTGDTATARCYAQANHYLPGEGPKPDRTRHALMMNRYTAELARDGERWRIRRLLIDCAWFEGDPQVLVALA